MVTNMGTTIERTGEAFEFDERLTVVGCQLQPGDDTPDFDLEAFDAAAGSMHTVGLADSEGKVRASST